MSKEKQPVEQSLEQMHRRLCKVRPELLRPDPESLEQPYAGEVVDTVTTYSVYEEPVGHD